MYLNMNSKFVNHYLFIIEKKGISEWDGTYFQYFYINTVYLSVLEIRPHFFTGSQLRFPAPAPSKKLLGGFTGSL